MNSDRPGPPDPDARVSRFEFHGQWLWYVDKYRGTAIFVHWDPRARNGWGWRFSDGGTLLSLLRHLRDFILKGTPVNLGHFGPFPAWSCDGDPWAYGPDMPVLRAKVEGILNESNSVR